MQKQKLSAPPSTSSSHPLWFSNTQDFLQMLGTFQLSPQPSEEKDFYSNLIRGVLKVDHIERGRVICHFTVTPPFVNAYGTLHGGVVAAVAELVMMGCARTVVKDDKELFLGDFSISYLSAARLNAELELTGSLVRGGRNITVTSVEFRIKGTPRLVYNAHATFYNMPFAKL